jgi:RhtB (resistance to homoserine/threonine) family protein
MDLAKLSTIALISLLGAMSPGPDFAIVAKNSLSGNFRAGFFTALGVACALIVHVTYCIFGIALIIAESKPLFYTLKYLGTAYLFYLGILLLKDKTGPEGEAKKEKLHKGSTSFVAGFLCNLLNPKATLFILSLFTQFIDPSMSLLEKVTLGSMIPLMGFLWFVFLSFLITCHMLQRYFSRFQLIISKAMGIMLCVLAAYIVFSHQ